MSIKRKMISILSVWAVAVTMLATTVHAAWITLGVDIIRQEKSQWCWAASLEMCATYLGYEEYDQWDIVKEVKGTASTPYPNLPGYPSDYRDGMEYATGNDYTASRTDTVFTINELDSFMDDMMPVIFAIGTYNSSGTRISGHAVVCYAVDVNANKVKYRDPGYDNPVEKYYPTFINSNNTTYCDGSAEIIQN